MKEPLISVIVPVYKVEKYLDDCVQSLLAQDYPNYEIILIDDGSPDNCGKMCDQYMVRHDCIKVIHQKNAGVSTARNAGMCAAQGEYLTFVDSDDWVEPDHLSVLEGQMCAGGMAVSGVVKKQHAFEPLIQRKKKKDESVQVVCFNKAEAQESVLRYNGIFGYVWGKLFDGKVIKQSGTFFRPGITIGEDKLFVIQYLEHIQNKVMWIKKGTYHYRLNPSSTTQTQFQKKIEFSPQLLRGITVTEEISRHTVCSPKLIELSRAMILDAKRSSLRFMSINGWEYLEYYKTYLKDIRKDLFWYLQSDTGERSRNYILMLFCSISPKLEAFAWKIWRGARSIVAYVLMHIGGNQA